MTIEERAHNYVQSRWPYLVRHIEVDYIKNIYDERFSEYVYAANEQHEIDTEKACKWIETLLEDVPEREWVEEKIDEFRKAIEEDV